MWRTVNSARPRLSSEIFSLILAASLMIVGMGGCIWASILQDFILLLTFAELTSVSMFFVLIIGLIPSYFPEKTKAGSIFYSGLAKEPYMNDESVYRPSVPLLNLPYDLNWDEYYNRESVKVWRGS
ncbi:MAG: hypothetical protein ACUVQ5_05650 [Candidatus Methanomethylicaceae archaeon]